ncbi:PAS domain S-box protein [bacterium]|nr:PAS domain S-box protein [bacterium]
MKVKVSLYRKFLVGFILIAALPLLGSSLYFHKVLQSHLFRDVALSSMVQARVAGEQVAWQIGEIRNSLGFAATQYLFKEQDGKLLSWAYRQHQEIRKIVVIDKENHVIESLSRYGYLSPGSLSPFATYSDEYPSREMVFFSQWRLEPQLVLVYPIYLLSTGQQQGYIYAELALKNLFNDFPRQDTGLHRLSLVSLRGEVVAHTNIEHVLQASEVRHYDSVRKVLDGVESAFAEYTNVDSEEVLGGAVKVKGLPLLVVSETPLVQAYALASSLRYTFIYVLCFSLVLILLGSWYLSRSMTRPIETLFQASERIRKGSLDPVVGDFPDDEIGSFARCFNQMVVSLKEDRELREAVEVKLRDSEKHYRTVADYAYDMECWRDPSGKFIHISPSCENVTGYSAQEFYDNHALMNDIVVDDDNHIFIDHRHEIEHDGTFRPIEFRVRHKDGSVRWLSHICRPIHGADGDYLGVRGSNRDITPRKLVEDFLALERERLAVTLRSIGDGVITTDIYGKITLINPVAETLTGWSSESASGRPVSEIFRIVNERTYKPMDCPVTTALRENRIVELVNHTLLLSRSGEEVAIADSAAPIIGRGGKRLGVVLVFRDVRDEKRLQNEHLRSEKLAAVGVLAGGIAHDFNNLLMGLQGSLDLLRLSCGTDPEKTEVYLSKADKAIDRAVALAQQLLTFAKGGAPVKDRVGVGLSALIKESAEFVLHGSQIKVEYDIEDVIWGVEIDAGQISQVLNNLVTNARQAMSDVGIIRVSIENHTVLEGDYAVLNPGSYVKVSVKDQGSGIAPEIMPRIFEPYFTSKETGSGLGLATSYSIIANHEGRIEAVSEVGRGTTFSFILPATGEIEENCVTDTQKKRVKVDLDSAKGRILLMDDEVVIREVVSEMLEMLGYDVVAVADGEAMLETYKAALQGGSQFRAVLMDLSIPGGMGGREAIKHLREIDSEVIAIVSSGYSQDPVMADFEAYGFNAMVPKPYKVESLVAVLGDDRGSLTE